MKANFSNAGALMNLECVFFLYSWHVHGSFSCSTNLMYYIVIMSCAMHLLFHVLGNPPVMLAVNSIYVCYFEWGTLLEMFCPLNFYDCASIRIVQLLRKNVVNLWYRYWVPNGLCSWFFNPWCQMIGTGYTLIIWHIDYLNVTNHSC